MDEKEEEKREREKEENEKKGSELFFPKAHFHFSLSLLLVPSSLFRCCFSDKWLAVVQLVAAKAAAASPSAAAV